MARYKALQDTFIAPRLVKEGTVFDINDDFQPGPHLQPLDDAATSAMDKYIAENPEASLHPIEALPVVNIDIVEEAKPDETVNLSLAEAASAQAKPGPTE